ncbi:hypothetical protein [uncultured Streptomyces sp.]|uniref:hypothetical protein n=1 Tax=uncultured Streptomyces sp. TaxID=174707 RepID=UPI0026350289|nr:hypothetical protein [uncultured Streptomyces sp.]
MDDGAGFRLGTRAAERLARTGAREVRPGLTEAEFRRVEETFGFAFADDHRAFLAAGLPVGRPDGRGRTRWPDWRDGDPAALRDRLRAPVDGVLFDVGHNAFWHEGWGDRPDADTEAVDRARRLLADVTPLVPVYSHRYLPAGRGAHGHPVLSVHQTDLIVYGADLDDYVAREFDHAAPAAEGTPEPQVTVPFWRDLTG